MRTEAPERCALMFLTFLLAILVMVLSFALLKTVSEAALPGYDKILILQPENVERPDQPPPPGPAPTQTPQERKLWDKDHKMRGL